MSFGESEREVRLRRVRDAVIQAVTAAGASPDDIDAAVREGMAEGRRIVELRTGNLPAPRRADTTTDRPFTPEPGSALAALLNATASY